MDHAYSYAFAFIRHKQAKRHKKLVRAPTLVYSTDSQVATVPYQHVHTPKALTATPDASSLCELQTTVIFTDNRPSDIQSQKSLLESSHGAKHRLTTTCANRQPTTRISLPCTVSKDKSTEILSPSSPKNFPSDKVLLRQWINRDSHNMSQLSDKATNWFERSWNLSSMSNTESEPCNFLNSYFLKTKIYYFLTNMTLGLVALTFEDLIPLLSTIESSLFLKTFQMTPGVSIGTLILPPYEKKSAANTKENSLVYFVIQGQVKITVNGHSFTATKASHFMVERGWLGVLK